MNVRKQLIAVLLVIYGVLFAGGVISYARLDGPPAGASWAGPLFLYTAFALVLLTAGRRLARWLVPAALGGIIAELFGLHTGLLFGQYGYSEALGWRIYGVPLAIGAAWGVLLAYAAGLSRLGNRPLGAALGAAWMVAADLLIDPLASGPLGYWQWPAGGSYFGVPLSNFAGWFIVSYLLLLLAPRNERMPRAHRLLGLSIVAFYGLLALIHGPLWLPAAISAALIGLDLLLGQLPAARRTALAPYVTPPPSVFILRSELPISTDRLFAWHLEPGAFEALKPPWQPLLVRTRPATISAGERLDVVLLFGPVRIPWSSEIVSVTPNQAFIDEQKSGPWASWRHEHNFIAAGKSRCVMEDRVEYLVPGGIVGELLGGWLADLQLQRLFAYRHEVLRRQFGSPDAGNQAR